MFAFYSITSTILPNVGVMSRRSPYLFSQTLADMLQETRLSPRNRARQWRIELSAVAQMHLSEIFASIK